MPVTLRPSLYPALQPSQLGGREFRRRGSAPFDPASTNPSAYYDRTNLATLFQDSAGTIPGAVGQPIGLGLDQSQGLVLGPELVTNGDFSDGTTGWVDIYSNFVFDGSSATHTTGSFGVLSQRCISVNTWYEVTYTVTNNGGYGVAIACGSSVTPYITANGVISAIIYSSEFASDVILHVNWDCAVSITDVSVKLLAGNHQSQATAGKRPVTAGTPIYANFDAVDDDLVATFPASLGAGCTVCRSLPGTGASITTGVTIGTTYTDNIDAHALLIYTAAQWAALDAGQIANITALLNAKAGL